MGKFVVCPGYVYGKADGDRHFISAPKLADLYELKPGEWKEFQSRNIYPEDTVFLRPRSNGDYRITANQFSVA